MILVPVLRLSIRTGVTEPLTGTAPRQSRRPDRVGQVPAVASVVHWARSMPTCANRYSDVAIGPLAGRYRHHLWYLEWRAAKTVQLHRIGAAHEPEQRLSRPGAGAPAGRRPDEDALLVPPAHQHDRPAVDVRLSRPRPVGPLACASGAALVGPRRPRISVKHLGRHLGSHAAWRSVSTGSRVNTLIRRASFRKADNG